MANNEQKPVQKNEQKPTLEKGNYLIEVLDGGKTVKKIAVIDAEINILQLAKRGMAIDLM